MITKKQFDVLEALAVEDKRLSQRTIAKLTGMSVGNINKLVNEMQDEGLIFDGTITEKGIDTLNPFRVKRAVFIAAGFGSRLVPITLNTPKPLIRVNGQRIIDSALDAVYAAGIEEVYVIRGYLGEQFDQLLYKYPNIKFIENPIYNESNNISSVMCAGDLLSNAYVLEADLLIYNPKVIKKYQYNSNYLGVKVDVTDDWCFKTDSKNYIKGISLGGTDCYHMFGISYWTEEDGKRLTNHVKQTFEAPGGKERFWDQAPLQYHIADYKVKVRECDFSDLIEIDTFSELKKLDKTYNM